MADFGGLLSLLLEPAFGMLVKRTKIKNPEIRRIARIIIFIAFILVIAWLVALIIINGRE
jgi:predicted PurR-regulated permease PerM